MRRRRPPACSGRPLPRLQKPGGMAASSAWWARFGGAAAGADLLLAVLRYKVASPVVFSLFGNPFHYEDSIMGYMVYGLRTWLIALC